MSNSTTSDNFWDNFWGRPLSTPAPTPWFLFEEPPSPSPTYYPTFDQPSYDYYFNDDDDDDYGDGEAAFVWIILIAAICMVVMFCCLRWSKMTNDRNRALASAGITTTNDHDHDATTPSAPIDPTELRSKVTKAMFAETKVDKSDLEYDAEANSFRWSTGKNVDDNKDGTMKERNGGSTSCAICLERFAEGDMIITSNCDHAFHRDCLLGWAAIKSECPMCRQPMWNKDTYKILEKEIIALEASRNNNDREREVAA